MKKLTLGIALILFCLFSCNKDKTKQSSISTKNIDSLNSISQQYIVDTNQSIINWTGYKIQKALNLSHFGTISIKDGTLNTKNNKLEKGIFHADMNSIKDQDLEDSLLNEKLITNLKQNDFFAISSHPITTFTLNSVKEIKGNSDFNAELFGTLEIKGIIKNISLKSNIRIEKDKLYLNTEKFSINRKDFNLNYQGLPDIVIQDNFDLQISIISDLKKS